MTFSKNGNQAMKTEGLYTEKSLIAGIKSGDETIMEYVYKQYYPMIAHLVKNNQGSENDAEDLYQEGLLTVFQKIREGEEIQYLKTYIYAVCRLKWLNLLRYRRRHPEQIIDSHNVIEVSLEDDHVDAVPYQQAMQEALGQLDETCRQLLLAFYFEKLSMEAIALRFNYNQANTAKSKKNKCMDRVRQKAQTILQML